MTSPAEIAPRPTAHVAHLDNLATDLADLERRDRLRQLRPRMGIDFSSNDYLGIAGSARLAQSVVNAIERSVPVGSGGSRLLRGNHPEHEALEAEAAAWFGSERALYFSTGYAANAALFATLPQRGDLIVHDELVHASAHEGFRLSRTPSVGAGHNDPTQVDDAIAGWRASGGAGRPWIAVESLYSMDGDQAPLDDLVTVAERHDAVLMIDEAHATGVFGAGGRGLAAHLDGRPDVITLRTCGKALGCEGALVCAPQIVRDFLINRGRGFIFSTAPSPLMAAAVRESLHILAGEPERRLRLQALMAHAEQVLAPLGAQPTGSQILPLIVGDDARAMAMAGKLQAAGFDVRGIRPPTVPVGTSRLRISLTLNVDEASIDRLADALDEAQR
jgi:8-amino-7-oxononanoate synthase